MKASNKLDNTFFEYISSIVFGILNRVVLIVICSTGVGKTVLVLYKSK
jgi:hypothetical protein